MRKKSLAYRMKVIQLESIIHHALIQLVYTNQYDDAVELVKCLNAFDLVKRYAVNAQEILDQCYTEVATGMYESVLQQIGNDTKGSYAILAYVDVIVEELDSM